MKLYVVCADNESGDHYHAMAVFDHSPTLEEKRVLTSCEFVGSDGWDECEDGPGEFGSCVYLCETSCDFVPNVSVVSCPECGHSGGLGEFLHSVQQGTLARELWCFWCPSCERTLKPEATSGQSSDKVITS